MQEKKRPQNPEIVNPLFLRKLQRQVDLPNFGGLRTWAKGGKPWQSNAALRCKGAMENR